MGDIKRADFYDGPAHDYLGYWKGRDYEHEAERIAIDRLLSGQHFTHAVDVGGGYGRITALLPQYADHVTLAEPSKVQLDKAAKYLGEDVERVQAQAPALLGEDAAAALLVEHAVVRRVRVDVALRAGGAEDLSGARAVLDSGVAVAGEPRLEDQLEVSRQGLVEDQVRIGGERALRLDAPDDRALLDAPAAGLAGEARERAAVEERAELLLGAEDLGARVASGEQVRHEVEDLAGSHPVEQARHHG